MLGFFEVKMPVLSLLQTAQRNRILGLNTCRQQCSDKEDLVLTPAPPPQGFPQKCSRGGRSPQLFLGTGSYPQGQSCDFLGRCSTVLDLSVPVCKSKEGLRLPL